MSELDAQYVKRGYWVNYEKGPVLGQTITTDSRTGAVIIALLAVLTSLGMTHSWHLLTFMCHQIRADGRPGNGRFRQQQALLRTFPTPSAVLADSVKFWLSWRRVDKQTSLQTVQFISFASFWIVGSLTAGIFSSYVVTSTDVEVLVSSPHCGHLDNAPLWMSYPTAAMGAAETYATDCYRNETLPGRCNIFSHPNVPFSTSAAPCPFNSTLCSSAAFALDSNLIDVARTFGLNIKSKDSVRYRKRTTCAMLKLDGHTEIVEGKSISSADVGRDLLPGEEFIHYNYGSNIGKGNDKAFTFEQSLYHADLSREMHQSRAVAYARSDWSAPGTFVTIPELQRKDADVALRLNMLNAVIFQTPVNDPMFSAHKLITMADTGQNNNGTRSVWYRADAPGTMTGCTEQYQFCFGTTNDTCTELSGFQGEVSNITYPKANDFQRAIVMLLRNPGSKTIDIPGLYKTQADKQNSEGIIESLPDDQWVSEIQGWQATIWAAHQVEIADHAIGPTVRDPSAASYVLPPANDIEKALCGMQKMRKPGGFTNINFFGLVFIGTISTVAIILDFIILRFVIELNRLRKVKTPRIDRWMQDGVYQLQRRVYEKQGNGLWRCISEEIPVTVENTNLPDLTLEVTSISSLVSGEHLPTVAGDVEKDSDHKSRQKNEGQ